MSGAAGLRWPQLWRAGLVFLVVAAAAIALILATGGGNRWAGRGQHPLHTPVRSIPPHMATWAIDDGCSGGAGATPSLVRRWVTFAETNCGATSLKARRDCRSGRRRVCAVMQYLNTDWSYGDQQPHIPAAAAAGWWVHAPARRRGRRIYSRDGRTGGYLADQLAPQVRSFYRTYVRVHFDVDDGLLMDWQSPSLAQELYYSTCGCAATREIRTNAALRAGHRAMSLAMTHRNGRAFIQVDNGLPSSPDLPQGLQMLDAAAGVRGLVVEGQPESNGRLDPYYPTLLDQIADVAARSRGFIMPMSRGRAGARYQARSRRVQEATMLLGYTAGHLVDWANLEEGSRNLAVWPEEGIVPAEPVQSMQRPAGPGCLAGTGLVCARGGHNSLEVTPGVYRRAFRVCYRRGAPFGPCAAIVNTTGHAVAVRAGWLRGVSLGHEIRFVGGDVESGGRLRLAGAPFAASSAMVPARDALLLSR